MRIKLDENIGGRGAELLRLAGHDVATVRDEQLIGTTDENLFAVCGACRSVHWARSYGLSSQGACAYISLRNSSPRLPALPVSGRAELLRRGDGSGVGRLPPNGNFKLQYALADLVKGHRVARWFWYPRLRVAAGA